MAPRPLYYPTDVQPILDRHCVRCHNGQDPKAAPDLRGELTTLFNRSYESLMQGKWVNTIQEWNGGDYAMMHAEAVPPYTYGSHRSRLVELLRKGHYDAQLSREECIRLVTWIDCGAPYYGSYFGRRNLQYQGQPDFRPVPTLSSACGVAPPVLELPPARAPAGPAAGLVAAGRVDARRGGRRLGPGPCGSRAVGVARSEGRDGRGARRFDGRGYVECGGLGTHEAVSIALWVKADSLGHTVEPAAVLQRRQAGHGALQPAVGRHAQRGDQHGRVELDAPQGPNRPWPTASGTTWSWSATPVSAEARGSTSTASSAGEDRLGLGRRLDLDGFRIGAWNRWESNPANNFHGEIGDVRIYSGMLTDAEAAQLAAKPAAEP